ncbi:MAG: outer membrane beta-barrel protein [Acidobacteria bacterium]|nr:outer membrane beta-barrel protein [Acidobacteriota bacterium]
MPATAQVAEPPAASSAPSEALVRWGPLSLQPRIRLTNLGVDTNVLNSAAAAAPARDTTATLVPSLETSLRVGRTVTTGTTSAEMVYFQRFRTQRSFAVSQEGRVDVLLARLTPFATAGRVVTHQRPTLEIDQRVEQTRESLGGGARVRLSARTALTLVHERQHVRFDDGVDDTFGALLDRRITRTAAAMNVDVTPLTSLVIRGESQQDRFDRAAVRDSDSTAMLAGFELKPFALISGVAMVGYRRVEARDALMPDFAGVVANVNASYVLRETTLVAVTAGRGVEYSIQSEEPYYVSTGGTVTIRQALRRWDVLARAGRHTLRYRALEVADVAVRQGSRLDRHVLYGAGTGVRLGTSARVGVEIAYERRVSPVASRQYHGYRAGGTVTYGY